MFSYQIIQTKLLVEDISQIFLLPAPLANAAERSFIYEAGQYVNIHYEEGYAPLSIASAPRKDQQLEFHLSHPVRNAKAQKLWQLALQAQCWQLSEAIGDCRVDRLNRNQPIIFLAYETGFAPIK
ncbi:MAG: hypothetical protein JO149_07570, partial [Gammaproteobacteria bacterium]|nr:hypothetical protein [Gammaproteobacteria bacterium]